MRGHRAIWMDGWKAVTYPPTREPASTTIDGSCTTSNDDFSECHDPRPRPTNRSGSRRPLIERFRDRRGSATASTRSTNEVLTGTRVQRPPRGRDASCTSSFVYHPPIDRIPADSVPAFGARSWQIRSRCRACTPTAPLGVVLRHREQRVVAVPRRRVSRVRAQLLPTPHHGSLRPTCTSRRGCARRLSVVQAQARPGTNDTHHRRRTGRRRHHRRHQRDDLIGRPRHRPWHHRRERRLHTAGHVRGDRAHRDRHTTLDGPNDEAAAELRAILGREVPLARGFTSHAPSDNRRRARLSNRRGSPVARRQQESSVCMSRRSRSSSFYATSPATNEPTCDLHRPLLVDVSEAAATLAISPVRLDRVRLRSRESTSSSRSRRPGSG